MSKCIETEMRFGQNYAQDEVEYDLFIDDVLILTCGHKHKNIMYNEEFGYTFESVANVDLEDYDEVVIKEFMKVLWDNFADTSFRFDCLLKLLTGDAREFAINLVIAVLRFKAKEMKL